MRLTKRKGYSKIPMESGDKCIIRTEQIKPNIHEFQNKKEEKNMVLKDRGKMERRVFSIILIC